MMDRKEACTIRYPGIPDVFSEHGTPPNEILHNMGSADLYNTVNLVLYGIPKTLPEKKPELYIHRLAYLLISHRLPKEERLKMLRKEYNYIPEEEYVEELSPFNSYGYGIFAQGKDEGIVEGRAEGKEEVYTAIICKRMQEGDSPEQISILLGIPLDIVCKYLPEEE